MNVNGVDGILFPQTYATNARPGLSLRRALLCLLMMLAAVTVGRAEQGDEACRRANDATALVVSGEQASDVFGLGQSVVVEGSVRHGVVAFGGDVVVRGRVEGDVASVGGSVRQCVGSYIGGDVLVFGGAYHHGKTAPGRNPASKTLMYAGYEEELRNLARNPTSLLTPEWSLAYLGQRLLAVLFWFIVSMALTAATPGAVGRAATRLQTTSLHVAVVGLLGALVSGFGVPASLSLLPPALGALVGILTLLLLVVAILFGRVVIIVATGRWLQRLLLSERRRSEAVALVLGALFWTAVLTVPYVWPFIAAAIIVTSLGLALTARYRIGWKRA
ncbi:MAG TPA: hypothetical protein VF666_13880 [Pyrinomonadaceae bacterium]|jgi:hypothetical protein